MRTYTLFLTLLVSFNLFAQAPLPVDENNKIVFTEVVTADSVKQAQLYTYAKNFLQKNDFVIAENESDSLAGKIVAANGFFVYAKGYISKKIHGKVSYQTTIEVKDGRYKYIFSNFIFAYYKEARTYKMVPSGKTKILEEDKAQGWQATWDSHRAVTRNKMTEQSQLLKAAMVMPLLTKNEIKEQKKPANKDNW